MQVSFSSKFWLIVWRKAGSCIIQTIVVNYSKIHMAVWAKYLVLREADASAPTATLPVKHLLQACVFSFILHGYEGRLK